MKTKQLSFVVIAASLWAQSSLAATIINLGTLGGNRSIAEDINAHGQVAGSSHNADGEYRAFRYENGVMTNLGTLGGQSSFGEGINDSGVVVGSSQTATGAPFARAARFAGGTVSDIGLVESSSAAAINNAGTIVGLDFTPNEGFIHSNGTTIYSGRLGGRQSSLSAINNSGQAVGYAAFPIGTNKTIAFRYQSGTVTDLGTLGGTHAAAHSINDLGQIVGSSTDATGTDMGFLYEGGTMTEIPLRIAFDINNNGEVVGFLQEGPGIFRAAYYDSRNGTLIRLDDILPDGSGWVLNAANAINDSGWIVGQGKLNGDTRAFMMRVPEPTSYAALASLGLAGIAICRRRPR